MRIKMSGLIIAVALLGSAGPSLAGGAPAPYGYAPAYAPPHAPYAGQVFHGGQVYYGRQVYHGSQVYHGGYGSYRSAQSDRQRYYVGPPRRFFWSRPYVGPEWRPGAHSYARFWD